MAEAAGGDASSAGAKRGRARVAFTLAEKVALVRYARACTPTPTTTALVLWLEKKYEKKPDRSAVSRWLKNGSELLAAAEEANEHTLAAKKFRRSPQEELETKLFEWFNAKEAQGAAVTDALLLAKARELGPALGVVAAAGGTFNYSEKWLISFKKRRGIALATLHGEAGSAPAGSVAAARETLTKFLSDVDPEDLYNVDETGLFYRTLPRRSLVTQQRAGLKLAKDRFTLALCCNAAGTDKLPPLVIGKSAKPRCFRGWNPTEVRVEYRSNKSAWMDGALWVEFLNTFDKNMAARGKRAYLLADNAGSHTVPEGAKRVEVGGGLRAYLLRRGSMVVFFPPNVTSHAQPLDQGIIAAFKARYRRDHLAHVLAALDGDGTTAECWKKAVVNVRTALVWTSRAWEEVTEQTLRNCWRKAGILPVAVAADIRSADERQSAAGSGLARATEPAARELSELLKALSVKEGPAPADAVLTLEEMNELEAETTCAPPPEPTELAAERAREEEVGEAEGEDTEEDLTDDEVEEAPPVTLAAARAACDTLHAFALENARALGPDKERNLFYLQRTLRAMTTCAATRQSQLQSYFAPAPAPPKALRAARDADLGLDSESMELEQTGQDSTVL